MEWQPRTFAASAHFKVLLNRLPALGGVGLSKIAFAINHDQHVLHPFARRAVVHLGEVFPILRLVHEELVHVLEAVDAEATRRFGEIQVVQMRLRPLEEPAVQRPLGQRNTIKRADRPS